MYSRLPILTILFTLLVIFLVHIIFIDLMVVQIILFNLPTIPPLFAIELLVVIPSFNFLLITQNAAFNHNGCLYVTDGTGTLGTFKLPLPPYGLFGYLIGDTGIVYGGGDQIVFVNNTDFSTNYLFPYTNDTYTRKLCYANNQYVFHYDRMLYSTDGQQVTYVHNNYIGKFNPFVVTLPNGTQQCYVNRRFIDTVSNTGSSYTTYHQYLYATDGRNVFLYPDVYYPDTGYFRVLNQRILVDFTLVENNTKMYGVYSMKLAGTPLPS